MKKVTIIVVGALVLIIVMVWSAYREYLQVASKAEKRFEMRMVAEAKNTGRETELVVDHIMDKLVIASHTRTSIGKGDKKCQADMEAIYDHLKGKTDFLCRLNARGVITHIVPKDRRKTLEKGFNGRRCLREVMKTGKPTVFVMQQDDGGGSREAKGYGKMVFTASPLYNNGKFTGLLGAGSNLTSMLEKIIHGEELRTGDTNYWWIIDSKGIFVLHHIREFIGRDAFTVRREKAHGSSFEKINSIMREKMMRGEIGKDTYITYWHEEKKGKIAQVIAYAPFSLGNERYSVALTTPRETIVGRERGNFRKVLVTITIITAISLIGLLFILNVDHRRVELLEREKKLLEEISKSEERYSGLFKNAMEGVFTVDIAGNFTSSNRALEEILGYTTGELMGSSYRNLLDSETGNYIFQEYNKLFRTGRPIRGLCYEIIRRDGERRMVEGYVNLIKKENGKWIEGFQGSLRDITEQKRIEKALMESEENYRALFEKTSKTTNFLETIFATTTDMVTTLNKKGFITFVNRAALEASGYEKREEVLGRHVSEFYDRGMERAREINDILARGEELHLYRMKIINREGREIPVSVSGALLKDGEGNVTGSLGFFRDITPLIAAEEEIKTSERRYRDLIQNSSDIILMMDMKGRYLSFNRAAEEKLDLTERDLLGKDSLFLSGDDLEKARAVVVELLKGKKTNPFEVIVNTGKGQLIAEMNISLMWEKDRAVGMMAIVRDITDKKRAEEEIKASVERYQMLLQNSSDIIYTADMEGRFTSFNKAGEGIVGFAEKDILGKHVSYIVSQEFIKKGEAVVRQLLKGKKGEPFEISARKFGEGSVIGELNISLIWEGGRVIGTMGILRDVTEKRKAEEELKKKDEELENFVYSVSHDLKAPVVSIQGFSSFLLTDHLDRLDDKGKRYLTRIQTNATKMQMIIEDLLAFSKVGMMVANPEDVPSYQIISEALAMLASQLEGLKVKVQRELPVIHCDRGRISQVFENLIGNSIKYMGKTESPLIEIGCEPRGEFQEFYVRDNGIGIDPKYHQKIFQIFQRLNDVEDVEGTGIGLAMVKKIVESHGGSVRVESEKEKGATFYFTLPGVACQVDRLKAEDCRL